MTECSRLETLLEADAAGALGPEDEARLSLHLEGCPACRAEREGTHALLEAIRLPALGPVEGRLLAGLTERLAADLARREGRHRWQWRASAGFAVAAMLALVVVGAARHVGSSSRAGLEASSEATQIASALGDVPPARLDPGSGASAGLDADSDSAMSDVVAFEDVDTGLNSEYR